MKQPVYAKQRLRVSVSTRLPLPIERLRPLLQDTSVCKAVMYVLARHTASAPLDDLLLLFDSTNPSIRSADLRTLRQPGLLERVDGEFFLNATGDADHNVRNEALKALKEKDPTMAIACCLDALSENIPRYEVSGPQAFQLLQEIHPAVIPEIVQEARSLLQGGVPGRFFSALALSSLAEASGESERPTPELLARLGELLDWPHWEVRMKAAQALGKLRRNIPDSALRRLLALQSDPRSRAVREAANEALAEILSLETGIEDD